MEYIKKLNLVEPSKIKLLYDPIIFIKEIQEKKNKLIINIQIIIFQ